MFGDREAFGQAVREEGRLTAKLVTMGRIFGPWGVRGWVRVDPYCAEPATLTTCKTWRVESGGESREYTVIEARVHTTQVIAHLAGVEDREAALALKGCGVAVPRETLPEPEEGSYYWSDLIGLAVVNLEGEALGSVQSLFDNGAHDVIEIAGEPARLVPWTAVRRVDLARGRIEVEWGADW